MTSPVSVIDLTNGELDPAYRDTLNSLPLSMAWSDNETAGIAIAQADALEPGRLACTNAHLILLAKPWLAQERDIETLAELEIPVMPLLSFLPKLFPSGTLPVESPVYAECSASITGTDIREILLEQSAMLGLMGALFDGRESFISRNHSYTVQSGATVFSGTYNAKTMFIDAHVVGMTRRLEVDITGGPSAQPAIIRTTTPTSLIEPALQYESSARISWRIALGHVRNGSALPYGLQKLRTDLENCRKLLRLA